MTSKMKTLIQFDKFTIAEMREGGAKAMGVLQPNGELFGQIINDELYTKFLDISDSLKENDKQTT